MNNSEWWLRIKNKRSDGKTGIVLSKRRGAAGNQGHVSGFCLGTGSETEGPWMSPMGLWCNGMPAHFSRFLKRKGLEYLSYASITCFSSRLWPYKCMWTETEQMLLSKVTHNRQCRVRQSQEWLEVKGPAVKSVNQGFEPATFQSWAHQPKLRSFRMKKLIGLQTMKRPSSDDFRRNVPALTGFI